MLFSQFLILQSLGFFDISKAGYSIAKWGNIAMTRSFANCTPSVEADGVKSYALAPSVTDTPLARYSIHPIHTVHRHIHMLRSFILYFVGIYYGERDLNSLPWMGGSARQISLKSGDVGMLLRSRQGRHNNRFHPHTPHIPRFSLTLFRPPHIGAQSNAEHFCWSGANHHRLPFRPFKNTKNAYCCCC